MEDYAEEFTYLGTRYEVSHTFESPMLKNGKPQVLKLEETSEDTATIRIKNANQEAAIVVSLEELKEIASTFVAVASHFGQWRSDRP